MRFLEQRTNYCLFIVDFAATELLVELDTNRAETVITTESLQGNTTESEADFYKQVTITTAL